VNYLSADDIIYLHDEIIRETGGSLGIRESGLLDSIVEKPKSYFAENELYPTLFDKAATVFEALCNYHVFTDGNKRTSALAMYRMLSINEYTLDATNEELEDYALIIATTNPDLAQVAKWIESHATKQS
jgi:death-on-curing protein